MEAGECVCVSWRRESEGGKVGEWAEGEENGKNGMVPCLPLSLALSVLSPPHLVRSLTRTLS